MEKQLISIIIPVYNVKDYLERSVKSVLEQTYRNLEVILIDDGSTDGSGKICDEIAEMDSRVKVFHIENQGAAVARNVGIEVSTGEYIGFIDSDDFISPQMYDCLYEGMTSGNADVVCCGYSENIPVLCDGTEIEFVEINKIEAIRNILQGIEPKVFNCAVWNKLYSCKAIKNYRFPDGMLNEDICSLTEIFDGVNIVKYTTVPFYVYNTGRMSSETNTYLTGKAVRYQKSVADRAFLFERRTEILIKNQLFEEAIIDVKRVVYYAIKGLSLFAYDEPVTKKLKQALNKNWRLMRKNRKCWQEPKMYAFYYAYKIDKRICRYILKYVTDL